MFWWSGKHLEAQGWLVKNGIIPYHSAPFTAISIGHMMINSPVFWGVNFLDKPIPYPIYPDSESGIPRNTRWVRICFFGGSLRLISGFLGFRFILFIYFFQVYQQPNSHSPGNQVCFLSKEFGEVGYFMLAVFGFSWPRRHGWHGRFPGMAWPRWVVKNPALVNQGDGFTPGLWRPLKPMGAQTLTIVIQSFFARSMVSAEAAKGVLLRKCSRALTGWGWVRGLY